MVQAKFQLSGKDAEFLFNNKATVQVKFQLSGKDTKVWFVNETTVQEKFQLSGNEGFYNETMVRAKIPTNWKRRRSLIQ